MAKVAVMGYGVVGSGVVEVLDMNKESIAGKVSQEISVKYILDIRDFKGDPFAHLITNDFEKILNDDEVSVVAEVMGGTKPAYDFTKRLLEKGKHVVTSNKELVAAHGAELLEIAKKNNVNYMFEASVGGGIPIIRPLKQCLAANEITSIKGILNGTTNYILTQMFSEGADFESALKDAQEKGYAERNPAADVEGHDACRKIAILSSLVSGKRVNYEKIRTVGITDVSATDVAYAEKIGSVIKLIGSAEIKDGKIYSSVEPSIVGRHHPLAGIEDVFNGVFVNGNAVDDVMFYGRGAGKLPTASAVVADVIDCVRNSDRNCGYYWEDCGDDFIAEYEESVSSFLIRVSGEYEALREEIEKRFPEAEIVIAADNEFAFVSPELKISDLENIISGLPVIKKIRICK